MNSLGKALTAATLLLAAGCTSPRPETGRHGSDYSPPTYHPYPLDHQPIPTPYLPPTNTTRIPNLPAAISIPPPIDQAISIYENALPTRHIPHPNPQERTLEQTIRDQHRVIIQGEASLTMLAETKRVLDSMPALDPCPIYFIPDTLRSGERNLVGWYTSSQPLDLAHIVLLRPLGHDLSNRRLRRTLIHELAHRRVHVLGPTFAHRWTDNNTHDYGINLATENDTHLWRTEPYDGARYGFVRPYAAKNFHEDIATLVETIRMGDLILAYDDGTANTLTRKRNLLVEYLFIHETEQLNLSGNTRDSPALTHGTKNTLRDTALALIFAATIATGYTLINGRKRLAA